MLLSPVPTERRIRSFSGLSALTAVTGKTSPAGVTTSADAAVLKSL
jgi:hypothetical protein